MEISLAIVTIKSDISGASFKLKLRKISKLPLDAGGILGASTFPKKFGPSYAHEWEQRESARRAIV